MARDTDPILQQQVIYSLFVRNHTAEGTFAAIIDDLPRIRALGCDAIWLLPIHPIGTQARKGSLGSPYAVRDYRAVNPEYGTLGDFETLVDAIHAHGMKVMIDVVYNHTSPDSVLFAEHPEWFYHRMDGTPGNHVGDWSDIIDLDYANEGLWDYQIETLCRWARLVDGFRCDVASFVPVPFWMRARKAVGRAHPGFVWLAETVHRSFGADCRAAGMYCATDGEAFGAFDMEYAYDVQEAFERYLAGELPLSCYLDLLDFQEGAYPRSYDKLRFLENHDVERIAARVGDLRALRNLTTLLYLTKGTTLIYAGQERAATHLPSLFDRDPIDWAAGSDLSGLMRALADIKHGCLGAHDQVRYRADDPHDTAIVERRGKEGRIVGVCSLRGMAAEVEVDLPDGRYRNLLDGGEVRVTEGTIACTGEPLVLRAGERPARGTTAGAAVPPGADASGTAWPPRP